MSVPIRPDADARPLLDALSTGVMWLDGGGLVRYLNPAAAELLGLSGRTRLGHPLADLLPQERTLPARCAAAAAGQGYEARELELTTADGARRITVDCTVTPLLEGAPPYAVVVELHALDRHLAIAREESLLAQQATWRQLTRALAHEVRNPLGGLRGAAQLLERELPAPAPGEAPLTDYTRVIITEADRLRALVDALLGVAQRPARRARNVHELTEHVLRVMEAEQPAGIRFARDYDPSLPEPEVDGDQIVQALLNLVRNAVQANTGRRAAVTLRTRAERQYTIGSRRHRLALRLEVEDDGPGVPPELAERLFFPLVSGRADGTGLGLGIAQDLVVAHGGVIEWTSRPGRTVFAILLPLARAGEES